MTSSHAANPPLFVSTSEGDAIVNPEFTLREMRGFVYENGKGVLAGLMGRCDAVLRERA